MEAATAKIRFMVARHGWGLPKVTAAAVGGKGNHSSFSFVRDDLITLAKAAELVNPQFSSISERAAPHPIPNEPLTWV